MVDWAAIRQRRAAAQTEFGFGWNANESYPVNDVDADDIITYDLTNDEWYELLGWIRDGIAAFREQIKEKYDVLPPARDNNRGSGGRSQKREASGPPWLKVENLTQDPKTARILGAREADAKDRYNDVVCKISVGGTAYFWGLDATWPVYKQLTQAFGHDPNNWVDKEVKLFAQWDDFRERNIIGMDIVRDSAKKGKG